MADLAFDGHVEIDSILQPPSMPRKRDGLLGNKFTQQARNPFSLGS